MMVPSPEHDGAGPSHADGGAAGLDVIGSGVDQRLMSFLDREASHFADTNELLTPLVAAVRGLLSAGGKRLRPAFVYWGYRATGADHDEAVYVPAAAVELFHAFALIHDDIMDRAPTRRGSPSAHEVFAEAHRKAGNQGDADWFGVSAAVLAGDLAAAWSARLFDEVALPSAVVADARKVFTRLQVEVIAGQYLEMWLSGRPDASEDDVLQVDLLKSGRYTVTRPLLLGAALSAATDALAAKLTDYGDAVGVAFQLRDDILGLFGDPAVTGKSTADDVREGKRTLLVVSAQQRADRTQRTYLNRVLGNPDVTEDDVEGVRSIVNDTGALAEIEALVAQRCTDALRALDGIAEPAAAALTNLAALAVDRTA